MAQMSPLGARNSDGFWSERSSFWEMYVGSSHWEAPFSRRDTTMLMSVSPSKVPANQQHSSVPAGVSSRPGPWAVFQGPGGSMASLTCMSSSK